MARRTRRPETVRIDISQGDWLLVKKRLTAGEKRQIFSRIANADGKPDAMRYGQSQCVTYLVDWSDSITDADDKPIVIRDQPDNVVMAALDSLDEADFIEINKAIEKHVEEMDKELAAEKGRPTSEIASSAISPSAV